MTFSFTGVAYLLGFFATGLLAYRFFQYWRREKTIVSKLFFYFAAIFSFFMFITAIAGLFFAQNTQILKLTVIFAAFLQGLAVAIIGYLIVYLKFPQISPWLGFIPVFLLGLTATILTILLPFSPYLEEGGGINWGFQPKVDFIRFFLFLITFLPLIFILIQQIRISQDPIVKARAIGISLILSFGIFTGLLDFFLERILKLGAVSSDIALGFLSIVVFIIIIRTQKLPSSDYVKK